MCCAYYIDESVELLPLVEEMNRSPLLGKFPEGTKILTHGEVRPTHVVPAVALSRTGNRRVFPMQWGFRERTMLINARVETAALKPTFREAWAQHRCAIPASCYFEWEHFLSPAGKRRTGDKYRIQAADATVTWLCGLYRIENGLPFFVVLTREPAENLRFIHDRMPLILPESKVGQWIEPKADPAEIVREPVLATTFSKVFPEQLNMDAAWELQDQNDA